MRHAGALGSRYRLESRLGAGAMGEVWLARDTASGAAVAAKLLRPDLAADPVVVSRFVQERAILLGLDHPHIVRVRDLVVEGDDLAIVMDLVDGCDLRRRLGLVGRLTPYDAGTVVADVLAGLAAAHGCGVVHRDVKPDNVLVSAGEPPIVKLSDFSIARLAQEATTCMTGVLGTPAYLAPEVLTGEIVTPAVDVYAAGIVLYELLAGRTPFAGDGNVDEIGRRQLSALPPPLTGLPAVLGELVDAMLAKDPRSRPLAAVAAWRLHELLPRLAGLARLPPAPTSTSWATVSGAAEARSIVVRGYTPSDGLIDPGRTVIRAQPLLPTAVADRGSLGARLRARVRPRGCPPARLCRSCGSVVDRA